MNYGIFFLKQLDKINEEEHDTELRVVGWFHTHPNLHSFLSSGDPENASVPGD